MASSPRKGDSADAGARGRAQGACASALSTEPNLDAAVAEVADAFDGFAAGPPDLVVAFATHHHGGELPRLAAELVEATGAGALAGCTGAWVLGRGREEEASAGLSALAAWLPDTEVTITRILPPAEGGPETLEFEVEDPDRAGVLLMADPFSFPTTAWLAEFQRGNAGVPLVGGLASGGIAPGQNVLYAGAESGNSGAVAVTLTGATRIVPAVSQGCRPVGPPLVATKVDGHFVLELRGQPAAKVMFEVLEALDEDERALFQRGAFVGRAVDPSKSTFQPGDLLVRNVMGVDPRRHALAIADDGIRTGTTLQLMVRDGASAAAELDSVLELAGLESGGAAFGALTFTCGGRGRGMFGAPHQDALAIERRFGPGFPLAGFSANGEIGPVGGRPHLHGFTASTALFAPRD